MCDFLRVSNFCEFLCGEHKIQSAMQVYYEMQKQIKTNS